jgi:hypothetical protein
LRNSSMLCWLLLKSCFTAISFLFGNIPYKFNIFYFKKVIKMNHDIIFDMILCFSMLISRCH